MRSLVVSHSRALLRSFSSSARNLFENKVAEKQKIFQENNDLPVFLKGGSLDKILFNLTMMLSVGGTGYSLFFLGWASFPQKNKT
ncbi:cytochrome c oxidase subunit 7A1, mitochondrial-like [Sarcophilus harrisii]|uniref:cytochrome c oxidase subunit 7A1, mitochondrial-like n=1 Tax=Sarcophilus harrisii TaxID=9305 RepID=UPI000273AA78|nr:cytochrome c oxidase subunit 7A1, mitochondrial-like [Sarcophilus harrisii]